MSLTASVAAWSVQIVGRRPLLYRRGADPSLDRPAHVRAASGLCWVAGRLVVVQDDARFVGVIDLGDGLVDDYPLPPGPDGRRVFDDRIGNKRHKPDLEVAFADGDSLVALGSGGARPARQGIVRWGYPDAPTWAPFPSLFDRLADVAGRPLNLEGGVPRGDRLLLAHRGGHRGEAGESPDVLVTLSLGDFRTALASGELGPAQLKVQSVALGALAGVPLHLTDLCAAADGGVWYSSAAEATDHYADDGPVSGGAVGRFDAGLASAEHAVVSNERGEVALDKLEGLALHPGAADRLLAVTDPDDPDRPGELLELLVTP